MIAHRATVTTTNSPFLERELMMPWRCSSSAWSNYAALLQLLLLLLLLEISNKQRRRRLLPVTAHR